MRYIIMFLALMSVTECMISNAENSRAESPELYNARVNSELDKADDAASRDEIFRLRQKLDERQGDEPTVHKRRHNPQ